MTAVIVIEGVVIVDLPPPGSVEGVDTGVAALVGEFADMGAATDVDGSGIVTTDIVPQEIFTSQDLLNKTPTAGLLPYHRRSSPDPDPAPHRLETSEPNRGHSRT